MAKTKKGTMKATMFSVATLAVVLMVGGLIAFSGEREDVAAEVPQATTAAGEAATSRAEISQLVLYNREIELSPAQEAVQREALEALPAPCCSSYSAATCCCECNLARATWGLAKHLIKNEGLGAAEVRTAVAGWYRTINPDGFNGKACFSGGCGRPFRHDGCGGMKEGELVF